LKVFVVPNDKIIYGYEYNVLNGVSSPIYGTTSLLILTQLIRFGRF